MGQPYIGEVRLFAGDFAPQGWSFCNGELLPISDYTALFDLIGTTYGGDGVTTFGLPNLLSRIPFGVGGADDLFLGELAGAESVTLTTQQLPLHSHGAQASDDPATSTAPDGNVWASWGDSPYSPGPATAAMDGAAIAATGGSLPHQNIPPVLALSFIISLFGIFPSQN